MEVFEGAKPNVKTVNGQAPDSVGNVKAGIVSVEEDNGTVTVTDANGGTSTFKTGGIPVGHQFFTTNPNIPAGCIPLLGGEYSRTTYADLWAWVQTQDGYLLDESAWQAKAAANGGNVPYYSKGDGSTTFRVPALKCWVRGAGSISEVGGYLAAGLPNIKGELVIGYNASYLANGAFQAVKAVWNLDGGSNHVLDSAIFDASISNPIYGASDTVQPPSIIGMWLVKAYGTVVNVGSTDVENIATGLTELETRFDALNNNVAGIADYIIETYVSGTNWWRKWKSGWVEQGGCATSSSGNTQTVTLLKPYANRNYTIVGQAVDTGSSLRNGSTTNIISKTATSFKIGVYGGSTENNWYTCGQGA